MCGIWTYIKNSNNNVDITKLFNDFIKIKHRGPDMSSFQIYNNVCIGFHRLGIIDPTFNSNQPYIIETNDKTLVFICNGEIYNYKELIKNYDLDNDNSDCLTIPLLYNKLNSLNDFIELFKCNIIKGEYAFVLYEFDKNQSLNNIIVGRDMIGIRPLYCNNLDLYDDFYFSSEIKGMSSYKKNIQEFEPGTILYIDMKKKYKMYYDFKYIYSIEEKNLDEKILLDNLKNAIINSVNRRLCSDKPIAFLLSGGVDSSLVAAISSKLLNQPINTYCCGMNEGTDLKYARMVANHINSNHTEVYFTPEEGLQAIKDVIYTTETWDTTTIRASVGQYLVSKYISKNTNQKVVLVGEGPDEVCSSYLFNYYAPNGNELHDTAIEYVKKIHLFDGRRADRCISKWGLEARISLLDPEFIEAYWNIPKDYRHPKYKGIEKWWLRKAFEDTDYLPEQVLWRKKEAFSDGVSSKEKSWFQIIQEHIESILTDEDKIKAKNYPSIEAYYYKKIFIEYFGENNLNVLPHYWQPKWINKNGYVDPSARSLDIYNE
jgi:asparagine synthase (glutamine-hydrolysing)